MSMEFSRELLFFFSALGAFNGLLIAFYFLFFSKPKHISNYFLGSLLLALSIRIGKSVFLYFKTDLSGGFLQFGMSACLFIGPSLYFYLKSITKQNKQHGDWIFHYLLLAIAITVVNILYPWDTYPNIWYVTFHLIYLIWLVYLILSGFYIRKTLIRLIKGAPDWTSHDTWIASIFLGNAIIWIAYNTVDYTSYIVGALSFSFVLYLLLLLYISKKSDPGFLSDSIKYGNRKIATAEAEQLHRTLDELIRKEQLFKNANLKLSDVAARLNISPHLLSQLLNDNLGKNFTRFINEYRIEAAKKSMHDDSIHKLESIAYECGFNSKSTFYTAFKLITGTTPARFKQAD